MEMTHDRYPILDRVPRGRDEGTGFQTWLRRRAMSLGTSGRLT